MKVLILGGAGFVGENLARYLLTREGTQLAVFDLVPPVSPIPRVEFMRGDIRNRSAMDAALRRFRPDLVVHAASQLPLAPPREVESTTVAGTREVLRSARELSVERLIFISSTAVYPAESGVARDEGATLDGTGIYAVTKIEAERMCLAERGMTVSVLRVAPVLGPGRKGLFHTLFEWVDEGRRIPMLGSGGNRLQLLDVDDLSAAIELLGTGGDGGVFNVGARECASARELLEALCRHAGSSARPFATPAVLVQRPLDLLGRARLLPVYPWLVKSLTLDTYAPVERLLGRGWTPRYSSQDALLRAYDRRDEGEALESSDHEALRGSHRVPWRSTLESLLRRVF